MGGLVNLVIMQVSGHIRANTRGISYDVEPDGRSSAGSWRWI